MARFRRNLTHLLNVFRPEGGDWQVPDTWIPTVQLAVDPLGSSLWEVGSTLIVNGALAQNPVDAAVVPPQNKVWYIQSIKGFCDDPVARNLTFKLVDLSGNALAVSPTYVGVAANNYVGPDRAFWLPSGWKVRFGANSLAAGQKLVFEVVYGEFFLGETPPSV